MNIGIETGITLSGVMTAVCAVLALFTGSMWLAYLCAGCVVVFTIGIFLEKFWPADFAEWADKFGANGENEQQEGSGSTGNIKE